MKDAPHGIAYEVAHTTTGRIRIRIPQLKTSSAYANQLQQLVAAQTGIADIRINAAASSIIITYRPKIVSEEAIRRQLHDVIQQAGGIEPETVPFSVDTTAVTPAPEPVVVPPPQPVSPPESSSSNPEATNEPVETPLQEASPIAVEATVKASSEPPVPIEPAPEIKESQDRTLRLNQKILAKRLQISSTSLRQHRSRSDFSTWSSARDPEGKSWKYDALSGYFHVISSDANASDEAPPDET